ncbi:MAG: sporulation protein YabP [Eubacteriales bacterium]
MEELNGLKQKPHKIILSSRKSCGISGVTDVLSFDVSEILLETEQGMLMIRGNDMHVNRLTLDKGEVDIDGKIDSLTYSEINSFVAKGETLFTKLFK